jgi:hypothetical protein
VYMAAHSPGESIPLIYVYIVAHSPGESIPLIYVYMFAHPRRVSGHVHVY